jgi:hypothetical protein
MHEQELEAYAAARREMQALVEGLVAGLLGLHGAPAAGRPFAEMGMDSIAALELRDRLQQTLHMPLPATLVFDHPSVRALTSHLLERSGSAASEAALAAELDAELDALKGE